MKKIIFFRSNSIPLIILLFYFFAIKSFSQQNKRGNIWYFGNQAGLDFNSGVFPPSPLTNGQMNTLEGCATMADQNGNLLFYTDGTRIWDRTHTPMPNANGITYPADWDRMLSGDQSSTQSSIVTPYIGNSNRFYVFTTDGASSDNTIGPQGQWDGLYYTIVDMSLNGGLGDIDTAYIHALGYPGNKILLIDSIGEKLTAAIHANGVDYWIITQRGYMFPHLLYAFHVSCSGVNMNPIISSPGYPISTASMLGYLTASFDGHALASGQWIGAKSLVLYDFNNQNGIISNPVILQDGGGRTAYGVAFSPNDSIIYAYSGNGMPSYLYRYQRYAPNPALTEIADVLPGVWPPGVMSPFRALQVAPDGRIYIAGPGGTGGPISALHTPNNFANPGLDLASVPLGGQLARFGLPNFFNFYTLRNISLSFAKPDTNICFETSLQIGQDSTWGWTFQWSPAAGLNNTTIPNPLATPTSTTTYTVAVILPCDTLYDTITLTTATALTTTITSAASSCSSNNGTATVIVNGGTPGYTYSWSTIPTQTTANATGLGMGNYTVVIADINNCTQTATVAITGSNGLNTALSSQINVSCNGGSTGSAAVTVNTGSSPYTYLWSNGQTTSAASNLPAGNYTVTITDSNSCDSTLSVIITEPSAITATTTSTPATCGNNDGAVSVNAAGGNGAFTYSWNNNQTSQSATGLSAGNYSVIITDSNSCTTTQTVTVASVANTLSVSTSSTQTGCASATGSATASPGGGTNPYTYSWNNNQTTQTATGLPAGNYTVTVTDADGCTQTQTVTVASSNGPNAVLSSQSNVLCNGENTGSAGVNASGGTLAYTYLWNTIPAQNTATVTGLTAGTYSVLITDANNCTAMQTVTISEPAAITATITSTPADCNSTNGAASVTPGGGTGSFSYSWNPTSQSSPAATGLGTGSYTVTVTDANGCTSNANAMVAELPCPCPIDFTPALPNAFSPNEDGENDVFCLQGDVIYCIKELKITIYNRWGEKVYASNDKNFCWNGYYKGKLQNSAVFVYYLEIIFISEEKTIKTGNLSLVR